MGSELGMTCVWRYTGSNIYYTECGFEIEVNSVDYQHFTYCPFCGCRIEEKF